MAVLAATLTDIDFNIDDADNAKPEEIVAEAKPETSLMVQRFGTHRDRIHLAMVALESEKFELQSRRDYVRRQLEAVDDGITLHIQDIEATLKLYKAGSDIPAKTSK